MLVGVLAALAVALFRHAMTGLESLFLSNDSGSLVNAAESMPMASVADARAGGLAAGALLWLWQRRTGGPCANRLYGSARDRRRRV
jgi:CIC family chloride channel protein